MSDFKEESKKDWHSKAETSDTHLQIGCLQRIAESLEKMEQPFTQLINDRTWYENSWKRAVYDNKCLKRRVAALQGVITKMKKKV